MKMKKLCWGALLALVCILLPVFLLNIFLPMSIGISVMGTPNEWLSFWGDYAGAIISALTAFVILYLQRKDNDKQNAANRNLQLEILRKQSDIHSLDMVQEAYETYASNIVFDRIRIGYSTMTKEDIIQIQQDIVGAYNKFCVYADGDIVTRVTPMHNRINNLLDEIVYLKDHPFSIQDNDIRIDVRTRGYSLEMVQAAEAYLSERTDFYTRTGMQLIENIEITNSRILKNRIEREDATCQSIRTAIKDYISNKRDSLIIHMEEVQS